MFFSNLITRVRFLLTDTVATYRWSDANLALWANEGIEDIRDKRPEARYSNEGIFIPFEEITDTGYYEYTEHSDTKDYDEITGWNKTTYGALYVKATSATVMTGYPSSADRTADTNSLYTTTDGDVVGQKDVTAANASGFGGTVTVTLAITSGETWDITATEKELQLDDLFKQPLLDYVCYRAFQQDSDDTFNKSRSQEHFNLYNGAI